jgi:hypothetical protein
VGRIFCPDFIGRVAGLKALDAALERARTGGAPTVLVGGEAGIGKSRLVDEFSHRLAPETLGLELSCAAELDRAAGRAMPDAWLEAAAAWEPLRELLASSRSPGAPRRRQSPRA